MTQKWIYENGLYFPVKGETTSENILGKGVFNLEASSPDFSRIGLRRIADGFTFDFKVYDLGFEDFFKLVQDKWNSPSFQETGKNLGIVLNGLKGAGKTIAAKLLSNRLGLPVLVTSTSWPGIENFMQSIDFECVVLIDQADKGFCHDEEALLSMTDGVYNKKRKLFILTTNSLNLIENVVGRPGRIRYIKEFGNLPEKTIYEFLDDNLKDPSMRKTVLRTIDSLAYATIDILKSVVEEVNFRGVTGESSLLNLPKGSTKFDVLVLSRERHEFTRIKEYIKSKISHNITAAQWLQGVDGRRNPRIDSLRLNVFFDYFSAESRTLYAGLETDGGDIILEEPDENGFFIKKRDLGSEETLCVLLRSYYPSLYKGRLV